MIPKKIWYPHALFNKLLFSSVRKIFPISNHAPYSYITLQTYVEVYMKWKKDPYYDSIASIHKSLLLKPIISLKNFCISSSSSQDCYCIPISAVSKNGRQFGINIRVLRFLRSYPSFFEEFKGPLYNLPWFRLTQKAIELDREERLVYREFRDDILGRLVKLILMSGSRKMLPLKIIKGLQWNLGLPDELLANLPDFVEGYGCLRIVDIEDGLKGLAVLEDTIEGKGHKILSTMQKNAMKSGEYNGISDEAIAFPLFPSKGLRLKQKIKDWLVEFQKLPYVSPYDDFSILNPDSDISEKRVVGLLHELLALFVEHAAERKSFISLRNYLGLPQKVHKAFERHPHMFYLSLKNKTCTAILKEAYCDEVAIEQHPLANVRKKYIVLMNESVGILKARRSNHNKNATLDQENACLKHLDCAGEEPSPVVKA